MKKHFYEQPTIVLTDLSTADTVIMSGNVGDNQIFDSDII